MMTNNEHRARVAARGKQADGIFQSARQQVRSPFMHRCKCGVALVLGDTLCTTCEMSQAGLR